LRRRWCNRFSAGYFVGDAAIRRFFPATIKTIKLTIDSRRLIAGYARLNAISREVAGSTANANRPSEYRESSNIACAAAAFSENRYHNSSIVIDS
jgi:hypothetical protein